MCGIAGLLDPGRGLGPAELARRSGVMADALRHRGPDDGGVWADSTGLVAFGHRRLAVVDLSPTGHQPMTSTDGRWTVAYNGELYNFDDLRGRLAAGGAEFRGSGDTEVLVEALGRWGLDATLEAAEGMFALAAWDARDRRLHLVRDRFGEKPLYYGWSDGVLLLASELKALATVEGFRPDLDRDALGLFVRHNCVPAPWTVYRGIRKVPPGHVVTFRDDVRPGELPDPRPYWSARSAIEAARTRPLDLPDGALVDRVEVVLAASVGARTVADVPVGAFLSGGIDSSLIVALMQEATDRPVRTFTVGFAERAFDESDDAAAVAAHLGTDHTALRVTDDEAAAELPGLASVWDEPFADVSQLPVLLVSRLARRSVTVALSGDGGDELFAGYNRHAWLERLWERAATVPGPARRAAGAALAAVPPGAVDAAGARLPDRWRVRTPGTKLAKLARVLAADGAPAAYLGLVSHWPDPGALVRGAHDVATAATDAAAWPALGGLTDQLLWLDTTTYLPDDLLVKVDRAAMAVSLETRVPFLDRAVFDLAWRLPAAARLRDGTTKWALRQVLHRRVPAALVDRPKMGFGVPIGSWLRGPLRPWAEELLADRRLRDQGLLEPAPVRRAWDLHVSGRRDLGYELWDVLVLQAWLDRWRPGGA